MKHENSAPDCSKTSLTKFVLVTRGREGFFLKKTIIALAAASSVALSHGVAVAEETEVDAKPTISSSTADGSQPFGSSNQRTDESTAESEQDQEKPEATGSSKIFSWEEGTGFITKFKDIAGAVAAVVGFLGSISALFANIEKIVKQFTK